VRIFEHFRIVGAHVLGEDFLRRRFVGVDQINRLDKAFERAFDDVAVGGNVGTRGREAVALHFDAEIADRNDFSEARPNIFVKANLFARISLRHLIEEPFFF